MNIPQSQSKPMPTLFVSEAPGRVCRIGKERTSHLKKELSAEDGWGIRSGGGCLRVVVAGGC